MKSKEVAVKCGNSELNKIEETNCDRATSKWNSGPAIFDNEKLMTVDELSKRLNISRAHAYKLKNERGMPFLKLGGSLRFRWIEIERWLSKRSCT
jgi:excisionase family DNA binding protein